jgi:hypothetical protein
MLRSIGPMLVVLQRSVDIDDISRDLARPQLIERAGNIASRTAGDRELFNPS